MFFATTIPELASEMAALNQDSRAQIAALPVLKRGQRVEDWMDGPCTVTSRKGLDYWVRFDDGSKALISRGDLTPIA